MRVLLMIAPIIRSGLGTRSFSLTAMLQSYPQSTDETVTFRNATTLRTFMEQIISPLSVESLWMPHVRACSSFGINSSTEEWSRLAFWLADETHH